MRAANESYALKMNIIVIFKLQKYIYEEKPMGAVSAFTERNYHCKPLMTDVVVFRMTDVTVIHQ